MKISAKGMITSGIVSALYAVLTLVIAPISYGAVQVRLSELMVFLAFLEPRYIPGLTLGCFLANLFGPYGMPDAIFGGFATLCSVCLIALTGKYMKKRLLPALITAGMFPVLFSFMIAFEIVFITGTKESFLFWTGAVAVGELIVTEIIGVPLMYHLIKYKPALIRRLCFRKPNV